MVGNTERSKVLTMPVSPPRRTATAPMLFGLMLRYGVQPVGRFAFDVKAELPLVGIGQSHISVYSDCW